MWELAEVETFIREHCIGTAPDGELLLKRADALALLISLTQEAGLHPAYIDIYLQTEAGEWCFEEDLTIRDLHDESLSSQQYNYRLLGYLRAVPENRWVALCDFADRRASAAIRNHPVWSKTVKNK